MKLYKLSIIAVALSIGLVSCNDFLEQDPPSQLTPESFYTSEDQIQAAANQFYTDILPGDMEDGIMEHIQLITTQTIKCHVLQGISFRQHSIEQATLMEVGTGLRCVM